MSTTSENRPIDATSLELEQNWMNEEGPSTLIWQHKTEQFDSSVLSERATMTPIRENHDPTHQCTEKISAKQGAPPETPGDRRETRRHRYPDSLGRHKPRRPRTPQNTVQRSQRREEKTHSGNRGAHREQPRRTHRSRRHRLPPPQRPRKTWNRPAQDIGTLTSTTRSQAPAWECIRDTRNPTPLLVRHTSSISILTRKTERVRIW